MKALLLAFLTELLTSLAKAWLAQRSKDQALENKGAQEAEQNAQDATKQVAAVRITVKPLTVDQLQTHTAAIDPDFRD